MSAPKHTPGPWSYLETGARQILDSGGYPLASLHLTAERHANAARIVACVNACEGLADPSVVPELLAMLYKLAPEDCNGDEGCRHCLAHALIARAEGGRE